MIVLANYCLISISRNAQLLLGILFLWSGCSYPNLVNTFSGSTMGTTYSIKIISQNPLQDPSKIQNSIDSILTIVNMQLSTWIPDSEISQFNFNQSVDPFPVSETFANVVRTSLEISQKTDHYFDVTVFDLMSLWGFGPNPKSGLPSHLEIQKVLKYTGSKIISFENRSLIKNNPSTKLDLNAIAKGYAVDELFHFLRFKGYSDLFVEIGGEVRCLGRNQKNKYWSIGVENPTVGKKLDRSFVAIIYSDDGSIATSGNYRNFVDIDGDTIGHTINPKTGYPVQTNILSVTVQSKSCMIADAWATALMAMEYEVGAKIVSENPEIKAIWILGAKDGTRRIASSHGLQIEDSIYEIIR